MSRRRRVIIVVISLVAVVAMLAGGIGVLAASHGRNTTSVSPRGLTVNGNGRALGVDPDRLAFAWRDADQRPNVRQTAYRILVSRTANPHPGRKDIVWDDEARSGQQAFVAYRGPKLASATQYWWTVQSTTVASRTGDTDAQRSEFAPAQPFVTGVRDPDWKAEWIRPGPAHPVGAEYTYVRKVVDVPKSKILRATAYVAAAHQYQLFIGAQRVAAGPAYSYPDHSYYEATDVTHALQPGEKNVIGVLHSWSGAGQGRPASAPGLLAEITIDHADGSHEVIGTDGTWQQHEAEWLPAPLRNDEGGFVEHIDGRLHPTGWNSPAFDARQWRPVAVIGPVGTTPFTHLVAQRTRIVERPVVPVSVKTLPSGAVVADYGSVIAARPQVVFRHGVSGHTIGMHVGLVLDGDGHVSTTASTQATDLSFEYTQRRGPQTFDPFTYLGFRYLEIDDPGESLTAQQLGAHARHAEMPDEQAAAFASSDSTLDNVWDLVRHSALFASQDQFVDTPTREKGQFLTDAFDISQATTHAFGEQNLTWQALQDFAQSQARYYPDGNVNAVYPNGDGKRWFLDSTERYPEWLWQYYAQTGDRDTLAQLYPAVRRVADFVSSLVDARTGLVTYSNPDSGDLVDWPPAMRYGYDVDTAAHTTANVLAALDFQRVAQMAALLGRRDDATAEQARHDRLVTAINTKLTRPDGVYVDGLHADGTKSAHAAQQASAFALSAGIVPRANVAKVGAYVASLGIKTGPMDGLFLLDGLRAAGRTADVVRILTDTKDPGWAYEIAHGGTFTWESWILSDLEGDSMSHGWGSSALVAFQTALLGVSVEPMGAVPSGPVIDVVAPSAGPARVDGRVPTIAGPVTVSWRRAGDRLSLDVTVPPNATARVTMHGRVRVVGASRTHLAG